MAASQVDFTRFKAPCSHLALVTSRVPAASGGQTISIFFGSWPSQHSDMHRSHMLFCSLSKVISLFRLLFFMLYRSLKTWTTLTAWTGLVNNKPRRRKAWSRLERACKVRVPKTCSNSGWNPQLLYVYTYYSYIYIFMYALIHWYIDTSIHPCIHPSIHPYIHTYIHTYIDTYIRKYVSTYIHTSMRTYVHTCRSFWCNLQGVFNTSLLSASLVFDINVVDLLIC